MMPEYYDRDGQLTDLDTWAKSFEDTDARRVAFSEKDGIEVSTVWLGLNHQYGDGPPLIFETMIFGGEYDQEQWRYSTEREALAGHERACQQAFENVDAS